MTEPQPEIDVDDALESARGWADQLCGDIVLVPFKDGAPDWSMTRRDLDWPDVHLDPADVPRLAILTDSFHNIDPDVPMGSGVSTVSWWDRHGAEHVHAIEGVPEYTKRCEGIVARSIASGWPLLYRKKPANTPTADDLPVLDLASLDGRPVPERAWFIPDLIPSRNVTLLSGDGGLGKSLLALQLGIASTLDRVTIGLKPQAGRCLYLAAEDEAEEFHRRAADVLRHLGASFAETGGRFNLVPLADRDALLAVPGKNGTMEPTKLFEHTVKLVEKYQPDLLVLDTAADVFGGDEIKRVQVRQFIGMLRSICLQWNCAILLLAHPSVAGMQSGTGSSGSTAWNNSVRSRLYLDLPSGDDVDPDMRRLGQKKSNYGPRDKQLFFRWADGAFVEVDTTRPNPASGLMNRKAEEVFVTLLSKLNRQGQRLSPSPSQSYAPRIMEMQPEAEGIKKKAFAAAQQRLLDSGIIKIIEEGPASRRYKRLIVTAEDFSERGAA
ncbi:AAA family ATPase [Devosia elaeis]|nr:AAA family ATPase [Devosia elaeis]